MTQTITFEGVEHRFPDSFSQAQISQALRSYVPKKPLSEEATQRQESGSVVRGIPLLGAFEPQMGAAVSAAAQPFTGVGEKGSTWKERYEANRRKYMAEAEQFKEEHPYVEGLGNVVGGTLALGTAGAGGLGARALGTAADLTLPQMVARGGASMAGISAADTALRGGDTRDVLTSAGIGAGSGVAGPLVGKVLGTGTRKLTAPLRGGKPEEITERAERGVAEAIKQGQKEADTLKPHEFEAAQRMGLPVTIADTTGELGRGALRSAADVSPEARGMMKVQLAPRYAQQQERMVNWLKTKTNFPDEPARLAALEKAAEVDNGIAYRQAMAEGNRDLSNESELLQRIASSDVGKEAMMRAAKMVRNKEVLQGFGGSPGARVFEHPVRPSSGLRPAGVSPGTGVPGTGPKLFDQANLQFWDQVRQEVGKMAWGNVHPQDKMVYTKIAKLMNSELDRLVPSYQAARQGAALYFGEENALKAGSAEVGKRTDPRTLAQKFNKLKTTERQLFKEGYADALIKRVNEDPNYLNRFTESNAERQRMEIALGPEFAKELTTYLRFNRIMKLPLQAIEGNSKTVRMLVELGLAGKVGGYGVAGAAGAGLDAYQQGMDFWKNPMGMITTALAYGAMRRGVRINEQVSREVAKLMMSDNPRDLQRVMQYISNNPQLSNALRTADEWLADIGSRELSSKTSEAIARKMRPKKPHITITPEPKYGGPQE